MYYLLQGLIYGAVNQPLNYCRVNASMPNKCISNDHNGGGGLRPPPPFAVIWITVCGILALSIIRCDCISFVGLVNPPATRSGLLIRGAGGPVGNGTVGPGVAVRGRPWDPWGPWRRRRPIYKFLYLCIYFNTLLYIFEYFVKSACRPMARLTTCSCREST